MPRSISPIKGTDFYTVAEGSGRGRSFYISASPSGENIAWDGSVQEHNKLALVNVVVFGRRKDAVQFVQDGFVIPGQQPAYPQGEIFYAPKDTAAAMQVFAEIVRGRGDEIVIPEL